MRGKIGPEVEGQISRRLPDISDMGRRAHELNPEFVSLAFPGEGSVPIGAACYCDAIHVFQDIGFAIREALAYFAWYSGKGDNHSAKWFERHFLENAIFRLYNVAEDLAEAIVAIWEVDQVSWHA